MIPPKKSPEAGFPSSFQGSVNTLGADEDVDFDIRSSTKTSNKMTFKTPLEPKFWGIYLIYMHRLYNHLDHLYR